MASNALRNRFVQDGAGVVPPNRMLVMLYDRLVADVEEAIEAIPNSEWDLTNRKLLHAQAIVLELHSALDLEAWDGAAGMSQLYAWFDEQLTLGNVRKDVRLLKPVAKMLRELRDTWHEAYQQVLNEQTAAAATPVSPLSATALAPRV